MKKTSVLKTHDARILTPISVYAPGASEVFVAGTFNDWNPTSHPMEEESPGTWGVALDLAPGFYQYKFLIDGEWRCDPACDEPFVELPRRVPNEFGTMNHVLVVAALESVDS